MANLVTPHIEAREGVIFTWRALLASQDDDGGEDEGLAAALDAADAGLEPLRKIAALPLETQAQVLSHLSSQGVTIDRLYDVGLSDAALACASRLKLRRERRLLQQSFDEMLDGAVLMNALGETVDARAALAGKLPLLLFASHASEACVAAVPALRELHGVLREAAGFEAQLIHVSCNGEDEAQLLRFMRAPTADTKGKKAAAREGPLPWLAAPPGSALHARLRGRFDSAMSGLPSLLLLSASGALLSRTAARDVLQGGAGAGGGGGCGGDDDGSKKRPDLVAVVAGWAELAKADAPLAPVDLGYDAFADPASQLAAARAVAGEGFDVRVSTDLATCACGRVCVGMCVGKRAEARPKPLLVLVGANWSRECGVLEAALAHADAHAAAAGGLPLARSYALVRLDYETSQAHLLKAFGPAMHHGQVPTIALLVKGVVVGRTSVRELMRQGADGGGDGDDDDDDEQAGVSPSAEPSALADALLAWLEAQSRKLNGPAAARGHICQAD